jgi:hypothetical protein
MHAKNDFMVVVCDVVATTPTSTCMPSLLLMDNTLQNEDVSVIAVF